jgi:hypothetical protein
MNPIKSCSFGDIIKHVAKGEKYVFLALTLDFVFIAKILSDSESKQLFRMHDDHLSKGNSIDEIPTFWFIKLSCEEFFGQAAHLANAQRAADDSRYFIKVNSEKLNEADIKALKKEILEKRTWKQLKDTIKDIPL